MKFIKEDNANDLLGNTLLKYEYLKVIIKRTNNDISEDQIDKIYKEAVKIQLEFYSHDKKLDLKIYDCMKNLLFSYEYNTRSNNDKLEESKSEVLLNKPFEEEKSPKEPNKEKLTIEEGSKEELLKSEENIELVDENGRLNLSFLTLLLIKNIRTRYELAVDLQISSEMLEKVLSGEYHQKEEKLSRLYKRYKTDNVYDLKKIIENLEEKKDEYMPKSIEKKEINEDIIISIEKLKEYSEELIILLKRYLKFYNMSVSKFSMKLGCANYLIYNCFNTNHKISEIIYIKLCIYFNVKTIEQLINVLREETKNYKEIHQMESEEIDEYTKEISELLKKYLEMKNLTKVSFSKLIGYDGTILGKVINKKINIGEVLHQQLCNYFKIITKEKEDLIYLLKRETSNYNEIIERQRQNKIKNQEYNDQISDLIHLYLTLTNISRNKFAKSIKYSNTSMSYVLNKKMDISEAMYQNLYDYFEVSTKEKKDLIIKLVEEIAETKNCTFKTKIINRDILFQMVDVSTLIDEEYIIFMLLFGEKRCLPSIISELLKINEEYIIGIYNDYLNKYIEYIFQNENNNIKKLEADN